MNLSWSRIRLELKCVRARSGSKEPAAAVFQSIFKNAFDRGLLEEGIKFVFHSLSDYSVNRIYFDRLYPFYLVFNNPAPEVGNNFIQGLKEFLKDQKDNSSLPYLFLLNSSGESEGRHTDLLKNELQINEEELVLSFHTPFNLKGKKRKAAITEVSGKELIANILKRINNFFGVELSTPNPPETEPYYWEYTSGVHKTKSSPGMALLNGFKGPLPIKKVSPQVLDLLLVCSEIHGGDRTSYGLGFYTIEKSFSYFDEKITNYRFVKKTLEKMVEKNEGDPAWLELLMEGDSLSAITEKVNEDYIHEPFETEEVDNSKGLLIYKSGPIDFIIEKLIQTALEPIWIKMWEKSSFNRGGNRDKEKALKVVKHKIDEGFCWIFELDIENFYENLTWDIVIEAVKQVIPKEDRITFHLIKEILKAPRIIGSEKKERSMGLPTGSPLCPLLANLVLDPFDEEMEKRGYELVRYAGHFLIFTQNREEAEKAGNDAVTVLRSLGFLLNLDNGGITSREDGFSFPGHNFNSSLDSKLVSESILLKTLYIQKEGAYVALEGEIVTVKIEKKIISRLPFNRIKEIIILGNAAVTTYLLHRCSNNNVPVTFCSGKGYHVNTLRPDSKAFHMISGQHLKRYEELEDADFLNLSKRLIKAKIENYLSYFVLRPGSISTLQPLKQAIKGLDSAASLQEVMGYEGASDKKIFALINDHLTNAEFKSSKRIRKKPDPLNSMLNFSSYLLFTRLNALVRSMGLNPYLGFLHNRNCETILRCKGDNYESLVCDLMEPFRFRLVRLILRMLNRGEITSGDFVERDNGLWLKYLPTRKFIQGFEGELASTIQGDLGDGGTLLKAQVLSVANWVKKNTGIKIYQRGRDEV